MVWSEIGVVFGFVVVCGVLVVLAIGVAMLFIVSIKGDFGQRKPRSVVTPSVTPNRSPR